MNSVVYDIWVSVSRTVNLQCFNEVGFSARTHPQRHFENRYPEIQVGARWTTNHTRKPCVDLLINDWADIVDEVYCETRGFICSELLFGDAQREWET